MKICVTERTLRLIDNAFGFDSYLLETPNIDIASRLGLNLKRQLLISLAKEDYYPNNLEQHNFIKVFKVFFFTIYKKINCFCFKEKYAKFVIPLEEADWFGLDLNTAAKKLQDLEDNVKKTPLKYIYEKALIKKLQNEE